MRTLALIIMTMVWLPSLCAADTISQDCMFEGFPLYGDVEIVDSFPDITVKVVSSFPDLKVELVDSFADDCGEWTIVDSFPDVKIQFVDSFADIDIEYVTSFPGLN